MVRHPAGLQLHLASLRRKAPEELAHGPEIEGNVILHPSAKIGRDCKIGPNVSIGIECVIENGARISNSVLLHRVKARPAWFVSLCTCHKSTDTFANCATLHASAACPC